MFSTLLLSGRSNLDSMQPVNRLPVKYDQPPVVEVVCGVLFNDLTELRTGHIGLYWASIRDGFPRSEDRVPLNPAIETFDGPPDSMQIDLFDIPPLPRVWFIAADGRRLIQLQRDRFLYNWKSVAPGDPYPSYEQIIVRFEEELAAFEAFVAKEALGALTIRQYEMTYVNHIATPPAAPETILVDHRRHASVDRFLPNQEHLNWRSIYRMPEQEGRLHLWARDAIAEDGEKVFRLDVTARGMPSPERGRSRRDWFDLAHDWITHGFADATSAELHALWKRRQ